VSIVVVVVPVVGVANAIANVGNIVDFHGCPSNLHRCLHPSVDALQFPKS